MIEVNNVQEWAEAWLAADKEDKKGVVLVFSALDWCVPCQRLNPHLLKLEEKRPDVAFIHVDDPEPQNNALMQKFNVASVPTVYLIKYEYGWVEEKVDTKDLNGPRLFRRLEEFFPQD